MGRIGGSARWRTGKAEAFACRWIGSGRESLRRSVIGVIWGRSNILRGMSGGLVGACCGMPTAMVAERERGVWRRYRLLPTAIGGIILSSMVGRFIIVLTAAVMQILLAKWIYKTTLPTHPIGMFVAFTFVAFSFFGLGLVISMLASTLPAVQALGQAVFLPMIMIGGVGVPLYRLPPWAQHVAGVFPGRYAVESLDA